LAHGKDLARPVRGSKRLERVHFGPLYEAEFVSEMDLIKIAGERPSD
jgi:hypothetical protein